MRNTECLGDVFDAERDIFVHILSVYPIFRDFSTH
jgi:hypothetical protein